MSNRRACLSSFWSTFHHVTEELLTCAQQVRPQKAPLPTSSLWPFACLSDGGFYPHFSKEGEGPESPKSHSWKVVESALDAGVISNETKARADRSHRSPG